MATNRLPKVQAYIRCPCCGRWVYLGKFQAFSIWDALVEGFDIPFEVDYRAGGGRGKGWTSRVRRYRLPNFMKDAYTLFEQNIRNAHKLLS